MIHTGKLQKIELFNKHNWPYTDVKSVYLANKINFPDMKLIVTNGHWFDAGPRPCGNYKVNGTIINQEYLSAQGFYWRNNQMLTMGWSDMVSTDNFIGTIPVLMNGIRLNTSNQTEGVKRRSLRTWFGFTADNQCIVETTTINYTLDEIVDRMISLGIVNGLVLDGSGSAQWYDGSTHLKGDGRNVFSFVLFGFEEKTIIYRVQVGAFSIKTNAENYRNQLQAAGYTSAFIKENNGIYRVQLGAFSIKSNAERLRDELISKGYNAFMVTE